MSARAVLAGAVVIAVTATPVAVAAAAPVAATTTPAGQRPKELQRALDRIVDAGAIGAVAEIRDRRGVLQGHSGVAQLGTRRAVPLQSRIRIASITKSFVAVVVLQLVDEGRLNLDDTVEKWLPGVVPDGDKITVRHLLNQTSGLYDYLRTLPLPPNPAVLANRSRTWTAEELIGRAVSNSPAVKVPGKEFSYSNTNYILLGEIIEKATGRTYGDMIEQRIIKPLRLRGTSIPGTSERIPGPHPHGYVPVQEDGNTPLVDYTEMNPSVMGAGGEIISTTSDLNRFDAALFRGRLLPPRLLHEMTEPGTDHGRYGLGLFIVGTTCGVPVYGHDGDALAYNAWAYSTKDGRRQLAVAITPDWRGDSDAAVDALVDKTFCG